MFGMNTTEFRCEIKNVDRLRDYIEYANRHGYKYKYYRDSAAGELFYVLTFYLTRHDTDRLAISALIDETTEYHHEREEERNSAIEDARREGYAQAIEDQTKCKARSKKAED